MGEIDKCLMQKNSLSSSAQRPCLSLPEMPTREYLKQAAPSTPNLSPAPRTHLMNLFLSGRLSSCALSFLSRAQNSPSCFLSYRGSRHSSQRKHALGSRTCKRVSRSEKKLWRWRGQLLLGGLYNFFSIFIYHFSGFGEKG